MESMGRSAADSATLKGHVMVSGQTFDLVDWIRQEKAARRFSRDGKYVAVDFPSWVRVFFGRRETPPSKDTAARGWERWKKKVRAKRIAVDVKPTWVPDENGEDDLGTRLIVVLDVERVNEWYEAGVLKHKARYDGRCPVPRGLRLKDLPTDSSHELDRSLTELSQEFSVPPSTISRWIKESGELMNEVICGEVMLSREQFLAFYEGVKRQKEERELFQRQSRRPDVVTRSSELTKESIGRALVRFDGAITSAARYLKIGAKKLRALIKTLGLDELLNVEDYARISRVALRCALEAELGDVVRAARRLRIPHATMLRAMEHYDVKPRQKPVAKKSFPFTTDELRTALMRNGGDQAAAARTLGCTAYKVRTAVAHYGLEHMTLRRQPSGRIIRVG